MEAKKIAMITRHFASAALFANVAFAGMPNFKTYEIGDDGSKQGQASLVDVDKDGDLDFITGSRKGECRWWEYQGPNKWKKHLIAKGVDTDVGGVAVDVNRDGYVDQISGSKWYENPGKGGGDWKSHSYGGTSTHDQRVGDIDGDGKPDLVSLFDNVFDWYKISGDGKWKRSKVGGGKHSGLAIGDIDGDGDNDIVRGTSWFENKGKGGSWSEHKIDTKVAKGKWSGSTASGLGDFDKDGDLDLAISGHDGDNISWLENTDGKGKFEEYHLFDGGKKFHSLQVADFNNDKKLDIYAGDTDGKQYIWENLGGKEFKRHQIASGPGHETRVGDVDGDGDIDLVSKPWNGGRHVYYMNTMKQGGVSTRITLTRNARNMVHNMFDGVMRLGTVFDPKGRVSEHKCDHPGHNGQHSIDVE
ncbi:MAG: VCBS repeat-containing protein [Okeania sp. SIO1H5]|uniref:FG-GAP repeat domain-containing protein n=1 Tax=Okeania sp. SIO1H5 TaxID=2607777 RepID=UPI0013BB4547|nr:VCBS repeat-containing protein [Okeania sp. SIO1H5]NET23793.1 VCBS repeat-containing protein [Okeania sp. SIO1H5]